MDEEPTRTENTDQIRPYLF